MTPLSVAIAIALLAGSVYAYLVFPVWVAILCANTPASTRRARILWLIACIVLAPIGSWAYCIFTPQRLHFRITSWLSIAGTIALLWFVTSYTNAEAEIARAHVDELASRVARAQMPLEPSHRSEITASLATLRNEIHGGVLSFKQTDAASAVADLLDLFLQDGRLTQGETDDWLARFRARRSLDAGALERRVQSAVSDSL